MNATNKVVELDQEDQAAEMVPQVADLGNMFYAGQNTGVQIAIAVGEHMTMEAQIKDLKAALQGIVAIWNDRSTLPAHDAWKMWRIAKEQV